MSKTTRTHFAFLLERSWELFLKFDPWHEATHKRSFSTFLYRRLYSYEVVNWYRVRFGDQRYRRYDPYSSPSITTPTAGSVDWTRLSTTGKATLRIAALISEGFSPAEIAASLGIPKEQISKDMAALRWEIHHQR